MNEYKRSLTVYLFLVIIAIFSFNFVVFVLSPANQLSNTQARIMEKLFERYAIERCQTIQRYQYSRVMYVSNCRINDVDTYIFFDHNGITHYKMLVDQMKISQDHEILLGELNLEDAKVTLIYEEGKVLYRVQTRTMEYLFDYSDLQLIKKVRLTYV
ncbi:MAG TPA: hypothetical protein DIC19_03920 [Erysipelotrichaceae bacterium]|nr:hypothetical protein [Erysipelotrichaceae bacterium]